MLESDGIFSNSFFGADERQIKKKCEKVFDDAKNFVNPYFGILQNCRLNDEQLSFVFLRAEWGILYIVDRWQGAHRLTLEALDMPEAFPFFVGITGKREFSKGPEIAADCMRSVRERLAKIYDYLERELPSTPKILLTGAAAGADIVAAEEVLFPLSQQPRKNWLVLAILPFKRAMFQQDFESDEWSKFERIVANPRTLEWELPNLRTGDGGRPFQAEDLERKVGASEFQKDIRCRHYEQVGLWIADNANVLLGVMSVEEPADKIGGTARIIACRRGGRPDRIAAEVIAASDEIAPRRDLHRPLRGYVWLIDPATVPLLVEPPVTVLPPASDGMPGSGCTRHPAACNSVFPGNLAATCQPLSSNFSFQVESCSKS